MDEEAVERRLDELSKDLDEGAGEEARETALQVAAETSPEEAGGVGLVELVLIGLGTVVALKVALPILFAPVILGFALLVMGVKLAVLGGAVYGLWRLYRFLSARGGEAAAGEGEAAGQG